MGSPEAHRDYAHDREVANRLKILLEERGFKQVYVSLFSENVNGLDTPTLRVHALGDPRLEFPDDLEDFEMYRVQFIQGLLGMSSAEGVD